MELDFSMCFGYLKVMDVALPEIKSNKRRSVFTILQITSELSPYKFIFFKFKAFQKSVSKFQPNPVNHAPTWATFAIIGTNINDFLFALDFFASYAFLF